MTAATATAILPAIRPLPAATPAPGRERLIVAAAAILCGLLLTALLHRLIGGGLLLPRAHTIWLTLHLVSVIPAVPLGAYVLVRHKGDRLHRLLGRTWAGLMMIAALSSFGLHGALGLQGGRLSWIHLLSILTLVAIPRGVMQAIRGDITRHRRTMMRVYAALVIAGLFTFLPGRLLGIWLFG